MTNLRGDKQQFSFDEPHGLPAEALPIYPIEIPSVRKQNPAPLLAEAKRDVFLQQVSGPKREVPVLKGLGSIHFGFLSTTRSSNMYQPSANIAIEIRKPNVVLHVLINQNVFSSFLS